MQQQKSARRPYQRTPTRIPGVHVSYERLLIGVLTINILSVAHLQDDDDDALSLHAVQDSIDANPDPIHVSIPCEFPATARARVRRQLLDRGDDSLEVASGKAL